ncbi:MAG: pirin family protein [Polaribacter sp.]|nr:pirin family protein [Polaribacter sp.]
MEKIIHKANTRGHANHGWLNSYHTFSFASYYNQERMNFGMLRVLNDDIVKPKMGFGTHPHKNMEIISIPISGALSHKDTMGNQKAIEVGEVQAMSAGTGLTHSEFNDSNTDAVNFLQIWIIPEENEVKPRYFQQYFDALERQNKLQTVVSPIKNPVENTLLIHQSAYIKLVDLDANHHINYTAQIGNGIYVFVIDGGIEVANEKLQKRDAIGITKTDAVDIAATENSKVLVIEVPMN